MSTPMPPVVLRVMQDVCPDFFTWDEDAQNAWKVSKPDGMNDTIRKKLLAIGLGKTEQEIRSLTRRNGKLRPTHEETEQMNQWLLFFDGVGKDCFYLNEHMSKDETVLSLGTLAAYDENNYHFQMAARQNDIPDFQPTPYMGNISNDWARCMVEGKLAYLLMSMAHNHVATELESRFHTLLQETIPYDYVPGPNHHKQVRSGFYQWDMVLDANGKEALHRAVSDASRDYIEERRTSLAAKLHEKPTGTIWMYQDFDSIDDTSYHVVFSDITALDVRFDDFLNGCKAREDKSHIKKLVTNELKAFDCWFMETKEKLEKDLTETA